MGVETECPASLHDLSALMFPSGQGGQRAFKGMVLQLMGGPTVALKVGGMCMAIMGFFPLLPERDGESLHEFWMVIGPEAVPHLISLRRAARLTLERVRQAGTIRLRARIFAGNRAGQRMARLVGFTLAQDFGAVQIWEIGP